MHYGHSLISINASELSHKIKLTNPHSDDVELYYCALSNEQKHLIEVYSVLKQRKREKERSVSVGKMAKGYELRNKQASIHLLFI